MAINTPSFDSTLVTELSVGSLRDGPVKPVRPAKQAPMRQASNRLRFIRAGVLSQDIIIPSAATSGRISGECGLVGSSCPKLRLGTADGKLQKSLDRITPATLPCAKVSHCFKTASPAYDGLGIRNAVVNCHPTREMFWLGSLSGNPVFRARRARFRKPYGYSSTSWTTLRLTSFGLWRLSMNLRIRSLTPELWLALEDLFGELGACNGCWCMYWRIGSGYRKQPREKNKAAFREVVKHGPPPGLIAFYGKVAVGWCQVTPRDALPWLDRVWRLRRVDDLPVWSISCLYVRKGYRRRGITSALISAALKAANAAGAPALEAYPLDADLTPSASGTGYASTLRALVSRLLVATRRLAQLCGTI